MKRPVFLFIWAAAMIFPLNWVRQESEFVRRHFDHVFAAEWVHIVSHLILFTVLIILVLQTFSMSINLRSAVIVIVIILAVAGLQELLQLQVKGRAFGLPEVFDFFVDLVGGILGWGIVKFLRKKKILNPIIS